MNNFTKILKDVCKKHKVLEYEVLSHHRYQYLMPARDEVAYTLRQMGWSFPRIGRLIGNRHHTTIMESVRRHERRTSK